MDLLLQLIVNGLAKGGQYALIGVAFGLIFATTRIVHFAFGPIYALAAYIAWAAIVAGAPLWIAIICAAGVSAVAGALSYLLLYKPLQARNASPLIPLLGSLGLFIIIQNGIGIVFGSGVRAVDTIPMKTYFLGPVFFSQVNVWFVVSAAILIAALGLFLRYTRYGKAVLAMSDNVEMARIVGVNTTVISVLVFAIGSAMAAVPAVLTLLRDGATSYMGFDTVFLAFIVVVIGGIGSIRGAVLGGILLGFVQSAGLWKIPTEWQSSIAFVALFVVLLIRPAGLFPAKVK